MLGDRVEPRGVAAKPALVRQRGAMSALRMSSGFGRRGQKRRPEKVPMKPSRLSIRKVEHGSRVRTINPGGVRCSRVGGSAGAGREDTGPANFPTPGGEGPRSEAEWSDALETKFLLFWAGHERDTVLGHLTGSQWLLQERVSPEGMRWCLGKAAGRGSPQNLPD